jgi:hypothetical protein
MEARSPRFTKTKETDMRYEDFAYDRTVTRRKTARRSIRAALGTSSDAAPNVHEALIAAVHLDDLLSDASGGLFRVKVYRPGTAEVLRPVAAVTALNALKRHEGQS